MSEPLLQPHKSVSEYFHEVISEAMRNQGVAASAHAEFYLVNLLAEYSHSELSDEPLPMMLLAAREAEPSARIKKLRQVGDQALYMTGFFAGSLEHRGTDVDYYITLGGSAYATLASAGAAPPWAETFRELAEKFPALVDVLAEVSEQTPLRDSRDLLKLYERYLRTGSSWTARRLRRFGLGVDPGTGKGGGASA